MTEELFSNFGQRLGRWQPEAWPVEADWKPILEEFFASQTGRQLGAFVQGRIQQGAAVYPPEPLRALQLTPLREVKVVILGQDPYHGPGQAHGLAFSVPPSVRVPPSLRNIYKEIERDSGPTARGGQGVTKVASGSLERWARQGVLLLNTCLTVEDGLPASHAKRGWEVLTDKIIETVSARQACVVFLLWGAHAQAKQALAGAASNRHSVLTANHPSPLSALRPPLPFIGCGHFALANRHLMQNGLPPVEW